MKLLIVNDESSKILGHRYLNSHISFYTGLIQLAVCVWALAQHVYSICTYQKVLFCDFVNGTEPVLLVGVDVIIFDIGLFHALWDIDSCVAQYLDGGYGRLVWCLCHIIAFLVCLPFAFVNRPKPSALWPLLVQQSAYGVGLLILSLAALPRILPTFTGDQNGATLPSILIYATGASLNLFLLYIYWHWYWHVESMWNSARKLRNNETHPVDTNKRWKRAPFEQFNDGILPGPRKTLSRVICNIQYMAGEASAGDSLLGTVGDTDDIYKLSTLEGSLVTPRYHNITLDPAFIDNKYERRALMKHCYLPVQPVREPLSIRSTDDNRRQCQICHIPLLNPSAQHEKICEPANEVDRQCNHWLMSDKRVRKNHQNLVK